MRVTGLPPYDPSNVFARILRGEIPSKKIHDDAYALAFHDIAPLAAVHVLVTPKGAYVSWDDFAARASEAEIAGFVKAVAETARTVGAEPQGYRLLANTGKRSGQEVPHLHVHIFGGQPLGPMLSR